MYIGVCCKKKQSLRQWRSKPIYEPQEGSVANNNQHIQTKPSITYVHNQQMRKTVLYKGGLLFFRSDGRVTMRSFYIIRYSCMYMGVCCKKKTIAPTMAFEANLRSSRTLRRKQQSAYSIDNPLLHMHTTNKCGKRCFIKVDCCFFGLTAA